MYVRVPRSVKQEVHSDPWNKVHLRTKPWIMFDPLWTKDWQMFGPMKDSLRGAMR